MCLNLLNAIGLNTLDVSGHYQLLDYMLRVSYSQFHATKGYYYYATFIF